MIEIPAGRFRMGSAEFYPEERPIREVEVDGFAIQRGPVTVAVRSLHRGSRVRHPC